MVLLNNFHFDTNTKFTTKLKKHYAKETKNLYFKY